MREIIYVTKPNEGARAAERSLRRLLAGFTPGTTIVVAIGGDGTMLHATHLHLLEDVLYIGVSAGTLGFMQTVELDQLESMAASLKSGSYGVIKAPLLAAKALDGRVLGYAFNDIVAERGGSRAVRMTLHVGNSAGTFIGDGIIFATPFGSTAYSLAGGGPIIDSSVQDVFVVTPSNPHISSLYSSLQRPHVLARGRRVKLRVSPEVADERPVKLTADGFELVPQLHGEVEIFLSKRSIKLIELEPDAFHNRIEDKRLGRS
jgi:NAD+ kinase